MSTLGQKPATQHVSFQKQTITGNGGTSYTLQQSVSQASDIEVFVNNTRQEPTVAYTANNTTLTMTGAVNASDSFYVIFQGKAIQTAGLPVDAAITASTITTSQTITSTGNITTSGTVNTPSINGGQIGGRRNIVINGGMQISQRGTSFSVSDNIYTLDRFLTEFSGLGAFTLTQSTDAPDGFGNSLKLDCTTADASPASGDVFQLFYRIEGQNLQQLKKGTSSAEKVTLSFFVKSNKTGNMQVNLRDANSRIIGATYAISSANTWERKTITFDGDTSGSIANDNTSELTIEFPVGSGSNYTSGAVPTAWEASSDADRNAGSNINIADNTANEWYLTGLQLEVGSQATPFEHRSFGEELALCRRYYFQKINGNSQPVGIGTYISSGQIRTYIDFPVEMRANPTVVTSSGTAHFNMENPSDDFDGGWVLLQVNKNSATLYATGNVSGTTSYSGIIRSKSADSRLAFASEL